MYMFRFGRNAGGVYVSRFYIIDVACICLFTVSKTICIAGPIVSLSRKGKSVLIVHWHSVKAKVVSVRWNNMLVLHENTLTLCHIRDILLSSTNNLPLSWLSAVPRKTAVTPGSTTIFHIYSCCSSPVWLKCWYHDSMTSFLFCFLVPTIPIYRLWKMSYM